MEIKIDKSFMENILNDLSVLKESYKDKIKQRQVHNKQLVEYLSELVDKKPDLRFGQILIAYGFIQEGINTFHEEPSETLKHIRRDVNTK
jgi:hypothetical protein